MKIIINGEAVEVGGGGSGGESLDIYSTEETRIGTWIDGKPLYRKVFNTTTPSSASSSSSAILHYDADIENVVNIHGVMKLDSGQFCHIPYYISNNNRIFIAYNPPSHSTDPSTLRCSVGTELTNKPLTVILEYTKTTDAAKT